MALLENVSSALHAVFPIKAVRKIPFGYEDDSFLYTSVFQAFRKKGSEQSVRALVQRLPSVKSAATTEEAMSQ